MTEQELTPSWEDRQLNEEPVEVAEAEDDQIRTDIQQIDGFLEEAEPYLAEALQALTFPEVYGLEGPESRDKALKKLRREIEAVQGYMNRARELSSDLSFCFDMGIARAVVKVDEDSRVNLSA